MLSIGNKTLQQIDIDVQLELLKSLECQNWYDTK